MKKTFSVPTHQCRSWRCRPSCRKHKHSGYTPPGSLLRPHMSRPPRHILHEDTRKTTQLKPQIIDCRRMIIRVHDHGLSAFQNAASFTRLFLLSSLWQVLLLLFKSKQVCAHSRQAASVFCFLWEKCWQGSEKQSEYSQKQTLKPDRNNRRKTQLLNGRSARLK